MKGCINFIQNLQKGKTLLNTSQILIEDHLKKLTELWPFFDLECFAMRHIRFSEILVQCKSLILSTQQTGKSGSMNSSDPFEPSH